MYASNHGNCVTPQKTLLCNPNVNYALTMYKPEGKYAMMHAHCV